MSIVLPGEISGLLRKGSPVDYDGDDAIMCGGDNGGKLAVLYFGTGRDPREYDCVDSGWPTLSDVALCLTDATGRAHAAWWAAAKLEPWEGDVRLAAWFGQGSFWVLQGPDDTHIFLRPQIPDALQPLVGAEWSESSDDECSHTLECLRHLDPNDPRLLEDGSRWVDAEALRLVCLHIESKRRAPADEGAGAGGKDGESDDSL